MNPNVTRKLKCSVLVLRSIAWTAVVPGTVTLLIPYLIVTRWSPARIGTWTIVQVVSLFPMLIGAVILLYCIVNFAVVGRGSLAPLDAPRRLVVTGPYRYVKNPMYVGVLAILLGEALYFESLALAGYAAGWFAVINLVVIVYEEPGLRARFGEPYERYARAVRRWLPGSPYDDAD